MRFARQFLSVLLMLASFTSTASAQAWTGPDTTRRAYLFGHAVENFDFAITEICLPYLLQGAEAGVWNRRGGVAPFPAGGPFVGLSAYLVGGGGGAIVGVGDRVGHRECTIKGDSADIESYARAAESRLVSLGFTRPADTLFPPSTTGERRHYCGPTEGVQLFAVSTSRAGQGREFLLTLLELDARDPRCVIDNAEPAPNEEPPPS
jgi:hypothetical protein